MGSSVCHPVLFNCQALDGDGGKGVPSSLGENLQTAPVAPPPHPIPCLAVLRIGVPLSTQWQMKQSQ